MDAPNILIPDELWDEIGSASGERRDHLHTSLILNGIEFHLEAIRVHGTRYTLKACDGSDEYKLGALRDVADEDGSFRTCLIRGSEYVVFVVPPKDTHPFQR